MASLNVPLFLQKREADCLAACAKMACLYLNKRIRYGKLRAIRKVRAIGTSFYNLRHLSQLDILTTFHHGSLAWLENTILAETLVIVSLDTVELPHWRMSTYHAAVIVGFDEDVIFIHDPSFADSPLGIDRIRFEFAWMARDYLCATIER